MVIKIKKLKLLKQKGIRKNTKNWIIIKHKILKLKTNKIKWIKNKVKKLSIIKRILMIKKKKF